MGILYFSEYDDIKSKNILTFDFLSDFKYNTKK